MIKRKIAYLFSLLVMLTAVSGLAAAQQPVDPRQINRLTQEIRALGPKVDPNEAQRAARIAYEYTAQLAQEYQITDPPIVHNTKVNFGLKPRGLCWHWAHDIEARLMKENFQTLDLHRAVATPSSPFRLEHSTAIVSLRGDTIFQGIVLDPWRKGGELTWVRTGSDRRYTWRPRDEVLLEKRQQKQSLRHPRAHVRVD